MLICAIAVGLKCDQPLTYNLEKLTGPVGTIAIDMGTYTSVTFFAYNRATDFIGYDISTGATEDDALNNPTSTVRCLFTTDWTSNIPTTIQLGGSSNSSSAECYDSTIGPLTVGTWISIVAVGSRECDSYGSDCSPTSPPGTAEVLDYIAPPTAATLTSGTDTAGTVYYELDVTMTSVPAGMAGIGLFYSPSSSEAKNKAAIDGTFYDGFCTFSPTAGVPVRIQIGGISQSLDCHITDFYLTSGDTIAVRNATGRIKYPWSGYKTVVVP